MRDNRKSKHSEPQKQNAQNETYDVGAELGLILYGWANRPVDPRIELDIRRLCEKYDACENSLGRFMANEGITDRSSREELEAAWGEFERAGMAAEIREVLRRRIEE